MIGIHTLRRAIVATALLFCGATVAGAQNSTNWNWTGQLGEGRTVYLHNINGEVRIEQGTGNSVEVRAEKRWRRGDPDDVRIEAKMTGSGTGDVLICALWFERATCDENGYRSNNDRGPRDRNNDVSVQFVVKVPANARVIASTVNGDIEARSTAGRVEATTVNGSITVRATVAGANGVEYSTVNGAITIELPANAAAEVDLSTVNGRISSDFPMTLEGSINPRRIRATIGAGGPTIRARTVNGGIRVRKL